TPRALRIPTVSTTIVIHVARAPQEPVSVLDDIARDLMRRLQVHRVRPYFYDPPSSLDLPGRWGEELSNYLAIDTYRPRARELVRQLEGAPRVLDAYVESGPRKPPVPPPTTPTFMPQAESAPYLGPAPAGIEARWAWQNGADVVAHGVTFVDVEQGWDLSN